MRKMRQAAKDVIEEIGAAACATWAKAMNMLKDRYAGQMDFSRASSIVKELLQ